ncbi:hypothetical protein [Aeromicrobium sp. Leaf350]|uniref:hypothetical protein n=1 Tax=Aeromicrobium sp. Leaf350 TaxID=2876565 RepID=UPI001E3248CC|nr:hypothetical protein [Aeromicrobium sp. Leaf350]
MRRDDTIVVEGHERSLTYRPRRVTLSDGSWVAHESLGGSLSSVWAVDLGDRFVEVVHLGDGPSGGELVVVVPDADTVLLGDLVSEPTGPVPESWPVAVDLAIGLTGPGTTILGPSGEVPREDLADFHQRLLGLLHPGHPGPSGGLA